MAVVHFDEMPRENDLPDKIVLVHQFGNGIVRNKDEIHPTDHVEVPLNYDGFGDSSIKMSAYGKLVRDEPIQYGGFKLFSKNDEPLMTDRKSTRLNSSHVSISYAVFCLKKKKK